jgi:uncharacterized Fe-S cluster-containing protein
MEIQLWLFIVIIYLENERKFVIIINGVKNTRIMKMNNEKTCPSLILNMKHKNQEKTQKTKDNNTKCVKQKCNFFCYYDKILKT